MKKLALIFCAFLAITIFASCGGNAESSEDNSTTTDCSAIVSQATDSLNGVVNQLQSKLDDVEYELENVNAKVEILPYLGKFNLQPVLNLDTVNIDGSAARSRNVDRGIMYLRGHMRDLFDLSDEQTDMIKKQLSNPVVLKALYWTNVSAFMRLITDKQERNVDAYFTSKFLFHAMTSHPFAKEFDEYQAAAKREDIDFGASYTDSISKAAWNTLKTQTGKDGQELQQMYLAHLFTKRRFAEGGQPLINTWVEILTDMRKNWLGE